MSKAKSKKVKAKPSSRAKRSVKKAKTTVKKAMSKIAKVKQVRQTKQLVDDILVKINPSLQAQIDALYGKVEEQKVNFDEIKALGLRVLARAQTVSQSLKKTKKKRSS